MGMREILLFVLYLTELLKLVHRFRNNYTTHLSANLIAQV